MLVYRFEKADGTGIYCGGGPGNTACRVAYDSVLHPSPSNDEPISEWWQSLSWETTAPWRCGFNSVQQLKDWFPEENWYLIGQHNDEKLTDFGLAVYEIDEEFVRIGNKQVMFWREMGTIVSRVACTTKNQDVLNSLMAC